jgi:hypothetical protein
MRTAGVALALMLAACAAPPQQLARGPIAIDALAAALIADLTAQEFQCQNSATVSECGNARHAFASCWDVVNVRIEAERITAERNRRCMGVSQ